MSNRRPNINDYQSFFIAPDGCNTSDAYDVKRKELSDFIDSLSYVDGSNPIQFVDVGFDEVHKAEIDKTNKERPDEE